MVKYLKMSNKIEETITELGTSNIDEKINKYIALKSYLVYDLTLDAECENKLLQCLNSDIKEENAILQLNILLIWGVLIKENINKFTANIPNEIFNMACSKEEENSTLSKIAQSIVEVILKEFINKGDITIIQRLDKTSFKKIVEQFEKICTDLNQHELNYVLLDKIVPKMYSLTVNADIRCFLFECAKKLIAKVSIDSLDEANLKTFKKNLKDSYLGVINEIRQSHDGTWHFLCIFLIQYLGKLLHQEIYLMNSLLRIIECGFRTKTIIDRIAAYDCWKELIDNYNLDKNYLYSLKQIKLLIKPLKIKLSKNEQIVLKRFDMWIYLMMLLQEKSIACLDEFLQFCFGPLTERLKTVEEGSNANLLLLEHIWPKSTEILVNLLGHYGHETTNSCFNKYKYTFQAPVINESNFSNVQSLVVPSVVECCRLLLKWEKVEAAEKISKCLWGSLLNKICNLEDNFKEDVFKSIASEFSLLISNLNRSADYFDVVLKYFVKSLIAFPSEKFKGHLLNNIVIFPLIKGLLLNNEFMTSLRVSIVMELFMYSIAMENVEQFFETACDIFEFKDTKQQNCRLSLEIWFNTSKVLDTLFETKKDDQNDFKISAFLFLKWFLVNCYSDQTDKQYVDQWNHLMVSYNNIFPDQICDFMKLLLKISKESPNLNGMLMHVLLFYNKFIVKDCHTNFVTLVLAVLEKILSSPCLPDAVLLIPTLELLLKLNTHAELYVEKVLSCIELFLLPHKAYMVLPLLIEFIEMYAMAKFKVKKHLIIIIKGLSESEDPNISRDAIKVLSCLEFKAKKKVATPIMSRSAKIAFLVKNNADNNKSGNNVIRLFGQTIDGSPVSMKGSHINKPSTPTTKQQNNSRSAIFSKPRPVPEDDDSEKYVTIDSDYKFQSEKLSEHQKEVLKKRREDIPALYQDLSQSQSNTYDFSHCLLDMNAEEKMLYQLLKETEINSDKPLFITNSIGSAADHIKNDMEMEEQIAETVPDKERSDIQNNLSKDGIIVNEIKKLNMINENINLIPPHNGVVDALKGNINNICKSKEDYCEEKTNCPVVDIKELEHSCIDLKLNDDSTQVKIENEQQDVVMKKNNDILVNNKRVLKELKKIEMDIVGAEDFRKNAIPRTRRSLKMSIRSDSFRLHPEEEDIQNNTKGVKKQNESPQKKKAIDIISQDSDTQINTNLLKSIDVKDENESAQSKKSRETMSQDSDVQNNKILADVKERKYSPQKKKSDEIKTQENGIKNNKTLSPPKKESVVTKVNDVGIKNNENLFKTQDVQKRRESPRRKKSEEFKTEQAHKQNDKDHKIENVKKLKDIPQRKKSEEFKPEQAKQNDEDHCKIENIKKLKESPQRKNSEKIKSSVKQNTTTKAKRKRLPKVLSNDEIKDTHNNKLPSSATKLKSKLLTNSLGNLVENDSTEKKAIRKRKRKSEPPTQEKSLETINTNKLFLNSLKQQNIVANTEDENKNKRKGRYHLKIKINGLSKKGVGNPQPKLILNDVKTEFSEDFIESSQKTIVNINPFNKSKMTLEELQASVTVDVKSEDAAMTDDLYKLPSTMEVKNWKDIQLIDSETQFDVEHSEKSYGDMDTLTLKMEDSELEITETKNVKSNDIKLESNLLIKNESKLITSETINFNGFDNIDASSDLPEKHISCSPLTIETPVRNSEFFQNTVDISPIKNLPNNKTKLKPVNLFKGETNASPKKTEETQLTEQKTKISIKQISRLKQSNSRSAKLLDLITNVSEGNVSTFAITTFSPKTYRIKNLFNWEGTRDNIKNNVINSEDLFKFTKELPSSLATPKTSILKRKGDEVFDEGISPCAKRKRVNFSDPPLTCKKIFFVDKEEKSHPKYTKLKILQNSKIIDDMPLSARVEISKVNDKTKSINFEESVPICTDLLECKTSIESILDLITENTRLSKDISQELHNKNISTISDLAKLSKTDVKLLPLKSPNIVASVLQKYAKEINGSQETNADSNVESTCSLDLPADIEETPKNTANEQMETTNLENIDNQEQKVNQNIAEVKELMSKVKTYDLPQEKLCEILLEGLDTNIIELYLQKIKRL